MPIINTYVVAHAARSRAQDKTRTPDQDKNIQGAIDTLERSIAYQKRKIKDFKRVHSHSLSQLNDRKHFDAALQKEKKIRRVGFVIAFIIIPTLIIAALCLFAPAVLPAIGHFLVISLTAQKGIMAIMAGILSALGIITIPPILYYGLISGIRNTLKFILGKDIFSEQQTLQKLDLKLNNEEKLLNNLEELQKIQEKNDADSAILVFNSAAPSAVNGLDETLSNQTILSRSRSSSTHFFSSNNDSNDNEYPPETTVLKDNVSSLKPSKSQC